MHHSAGNEQTHSSSFPLQLILCCPLTLHRLQGDPGDLFYVIKEGEASVYQV